MFKQKIKKIIIGLLAGFISGLFSTGGGLILVPAFTYLLKLDTVEARATSIMCILPMVLTTSFFYAKNKYIDWKLGFLCAIGGIIGSYIGSKVISKIPTYILKISFAIFLIYCKIFVRKSYLCQKIPVFGTLPTLNQHLIFLIFHLNCNILHCFCNNLHQSI